MAMETDRAVPLLLQFRHEPYMFHQANLKIITGADSHLITYISGVFQTMRKYTTLPINTLKMELLGLTFLERRARSICDYKVQFVSAGPNTPITLVKLYYHSTCNCKIPITGLKLAPWGTAVTSEVSGPDTTTYIQLGSPLAALTSIGNAPPTPTPAPPTPSPSCVGFLMDTLISFPLASSGNPVVGPTPLC